MDEIFPTKILLATDGSEDSNHAAGFLYGRYLLV